MIATQTNSSAPFENGCTSLRVHSRKWFEEIIEVTPEGASYPRV